LQEGLIARQAPVSTLLRS